MKRFMGTLGGTESVHSILDNELIAASAFLAPESPDLRDQPCSSIAVLLFSKQL
jgi:hypothetical protein